MTLRCRPCFLFALFLSMVGNVYAANLTGADLQDCTVLTGAKKQPQYKKFIGELQRAAVNYDEKSGLVLAGVLNNRFVCLEEEHLGETPWTMVLEKLGTREVETTHRPTLKNLKQYPSVYAALQEAIAAYQRVAESRPEARMALGQYYAHYHDALAKAEDGYFYLASAYEAECGTPAASGRNNQRCLILKQDKLLYLPLLDSAQRTALDQKAKQWAKQYLAQLTQK